MARDVGPGPLWRLDCVSHPPGDVAGWPVPRREWRNPTERERAIRVPGLRPGRRRIELLLSDRERGRREQRRELDHPRGQGPYTLPPRLEPPRDAGVPDGSV